MADDVAETTRKAIVQFDKGHVREGRDAALSAVHANGDFIAALLLLRVIRRHCPALFKGAENSDQSLLQRAKDAPPPMREAARVFFNPVVTGGESVQPTPTLVFLAGWWLDLVERDRSGRAAALYARGAAMGYPPAQCALAQCRLTGYGVAKDDAEALRLYRLAVDAGYPPAQYNLGLCYQGGEGVPRDPAEAVRLFRLAAARGYSPAHFVLGVCYYDGDGVAKDVSEAVRMYRLAADEGDARAQYNLGLCYKTAA
eukprot:m51a1_g12207 hypothetical protein (256) ;mRNA; r:791-2269